MELSHRGCEGDFGRFDLTAEANTENQNLKRRDYQGHLEHMIEHINKKC